MKTEEKYYINADDMLFIHTICNGKTWGWHMYYDKKFRMCASKPRCHLCEISKLNFDELLFTEKL